MSVILLGLVPTDYPEIDGMQEFGLLVGDIPVPREGEIISVEGGDYYRVTQVVYDYAISRDEDKRIREDHDLDAPHIGLHVERAEDHDP